MTAVPQAHGLLVIIEMRWIEFSCQLIEHQTAPKKPNITHDSFEHTDGNYFQIKFLPVQNVATRKN